MATQNKNEPEDELIISYEAPLEPCPEGRQPMICVDVFKAESEEQTYDGVTKLYEKVMFVFQAFPDITVYGEDGARDSKGRPFQVERKFTWSLDPRGLLRQALESWRGREFTEDELKGFSLAKCKGVEAWGTIVHNTRWVNIEAIEPYKDDDGNALPPLKAEAYTRRNYKKREKTQTASQSTSQSSTQPASQGSKDASDFVPF